MPSRNQGGYNTSAKQSQNGKDKWATPLEGQLKGRLTWMDCPAEDLLECIVAVTEDGAAVLLSKTSDGGALLIQVLADHSKPKWYPANTAALNEALREITERASS